MKMKHRVLLTHTGKRALSHLTRTLKVTDGCCRPHAINLDIYCAGGSLHDMRTLTSLTDMDVRAMCGRVRVCVCAMHALCATDRGVDMVSCCDVVLRGACGLVGVCSDFVRSDAIKGRAVAPILWLSLSPFCSPIFYFLHLSCVMRFPCTVRMQGCSTHPHTRQRQSYSYVRFGDFPVFLACAPKHVEVLFLCRA